MKTLVESAQAAKAASLEIAQLTTEQKNKALREMAGALLKRTPEILAANEKDMQKGRESGMPESLLDRLMLNEARIAGMAEGLDQVADLPDPIGRVMDEWTRPNGLVIRKVRVPMGVIGIIYEARPNVTVDAAALAFKAGSAMLLRGSSSAYESNAALVRVMRESLEKSGVTPDAVCLVEDPSHETVDRMLKLREFIDLIVPRGGAKLINNAVMNSTVPVLQTGTGNCHVYVDATADYAMAEAIVINAKTQRTGVCNAAESLLVEKSWAEKHLGSLLAALKGKSVELHGDEPAASYTTAIKYPVLAGGIAVRRETTGSVKAMMQLMPLKIDKVGAASVLSGNERYEMADNVQAYLWYKGQYYPTKLAQVDADGYHLTGWYDNFGCAAGKKVRVIIAVKND